jgi:hypothetical protein
MVRSGMFGFAVDSVVCLDELGTGRIGSVVLGYGLMR